MSEESLLLVGYKPTSRDYFLRGFLGCVLATMIALWFYPAAIPLLLVAASLMGEMWWCSKLPLKLAPSGLLYGEETIGWDQVVRYTLWGPVIGIPWTSIKLQGVHLYLKDGKTFSINSNAPGFSALDQHLKAKQFAPLPETVWYHYPARPVRALRYLVGFIFGGLYMLVVALVNFLLIVVGVVAGFFLFQYVYQITTKLRRGEGKVSPERIWLFTMGCLVGGAALFLAFHYIPILKAIMGYIIWVVTTLIVSPIAFIISKSDWLPLLIGFIAVAVLVWAPWRPAPLALIQEAVFVGKNRAYPLRHLRAARMTSKFLVFKMWQLIFANGEIVAFPLLEDFESFKKKVESQWDEVGKRYYGKPLPEEEAKIRTPKEEAKKILPASL